MSKSVLSPDGHMHRRQILQSGAALAIAGPAVLADAGVPAREVAVAPSGRFVYGSNRGHDSIAIFAVDRVNGTLTPVDWVSTQGKTPRFFALDPTANFLYAANQDTDTVVTFRVNQRNGRLSPTGQIVKVGSPCTIVFTGA